MAIGADMTELHFINFKEDINYKVVAENQQQNTLFLFPTRASCKKAKQIFLQNWNFNASLFYTFDEFKEEFFLSEFPLLREEKRLLTLYKIMSEVDREFFRLHDYFKAIDFLQKLLPFWQELAEESVSDEQVLEILAQTESAGDWQQEMYRRIVQLKHNYQNYLQQNGLSDPVFNLDLNKVDSTIYQNLQQVVVVNQFYYTKLEKKILENVQLPVKIYYQLPADMINQENLQLQRAITAADIATSLTDKISVAQFKDDFSMLAHLFNQLQAPATILDFRFQQQPYSAFFDPQKFAIASGNTFSQSRFFQFLHNLHQLHTDFEDSKFSLQTLLDACLDDLFLEYFDIEEKAELRAQLFKLIDRDFKQIDIDFFTEENLLQKLLLDLVAIIDDLNKVKDAQTLVEFYSYKLDLAKFSQTYEFKYTDLPEVYFQALADFASLDNSVENWREIFPNKLAPMLGQLFLDYLKPQKPKSTSESRPAYKITNLQDTRNLKFNKLHILHISEGVLPAARKNQFLFSENQRQKLGLKTYEDIKNRDKYYFYRLLAQSEQPIIYTIHSETENVEVSSFLEELRLAGLTEKFQKYEASPQLYAEFFGQFKSSSQQWPIPQQIPADFFHIPFHTDDFAPQKFKVSFSSWNNFQQSPFEYYFQNILGLRQHQPEIEADFSSTLLGDIAHDVLNRVWQKYIAAFKTNKLSGNFYKYAENFIQNAVELIQGSYKLKYKAPQNYSEEYFRKVFLELIKEGVKNFILRLYNNYLPENGWLQVMPEKGKATEKFVSEHDGIKIFLRGRADLQVETSAGKICIFDYKTGAANYPKVKRYLNQLIFYETLYYLLDDPQKQEVLDSAIYFIEAKELKRKKKNDLDVKTELENMVETILEKGYPLLAKKAEYEDVDITRRDRAELQEQKK
jgi:hypothetical protein